MPNPLNDGHLYEFDSFRFDAFRGVLYRNDDLIPLAPKALEILAALLERPQEVLTKEELIRAVWPDTYVEECNLTHNIAVLRKTLEGRGGGRSLIQTVPKRGYRFTGEVRQIRGGFVAPGSQ
jgi:DNA-binding winged helix-turn-helix (wHTH) protein